MHDYYAGGFLMTRFTIVANHTLIYYTKACLMAYPSISWALHSTVGECVCVWIYFFVLSINSLHFIKTSLSEGVTLIRPMKKQ